MNKRKGTTRRFYNRVYGAQETLARSVMPNTGGDSIPQRDAYEITTSELLAKAADLVDRALLQMEVTETSCPHCQTRLFADRGQAKLYEQLCNLPSKLRNLSGQIAELAAQPTEPSPGFVSARMEQLRRRQAGENV